MNTPPTVSRQEWHVAREEMLVKEKELTRARDALAAERRRMPWMAVAKEDDQLPAPVEQVEQARLAGGPVELASSSSPVSAVGPTVAVAAALSSPTRSHTSLT